MAPLKYPKTRRVDCEESLAGITFADPYRWLEDETGEVRIWQKTQAALASQTVRDWPHFESLKESVAHFNTPRFGSPPCSAGGKWFRLDIAEGEVQPAAVVSDTIFGASRILFDPGAQDCPAPPHIAWISPSPDGRILALGLCTDGSEHNRIILIDVASGHPLPDPPPQTLMDNWTGGARWHANSRGFYFTGLAGAALDFQQRIFEYCLADRSVREPEVPLIDAGQDYVVALPSPDGRWVVATQRIMNPVPVAILDLAEDAPHWRPFVTQVGGTLAGHVVGDRYVAVTDVDAPRGRVVAIPLDTPQPNDTAVWEEIVPEGDGVMRTLRPVGDRLYVQEFVDTYARIRIFGADGTPAGEVPLPARGAVAEPYLPLTNLCRPQEKDCLLFGFSSLTSSWGTYLHRPDLPGLQTLNPPAITVPQAVVEDYWAVSSDGTRIPYHVVHVPGASPGSPRPALLWGYGGYNIPLPPQFPGAIAAIVGAGGIYVHCHLRGGSEFGRDWWEGGRQRNKQNCYDDLYAIAEDLIARGISRADLLGVAGGSNGGLMAGVAAMQRPDLWRVSVARVPVLDLIADCRDPYGRSTTQMEYADPDDPEDVRRMATFSPYQLVVDGQSYPAMYIDAGTADPRCAPWHARKFAARLQAAQAADVPVLVHIWEDVGHGSATAIDVQIEQNCEWLAFVMQQLGLIPNG